MQEMCCNTVIFWNNEVSEDTNQGKSYLLVNWQQVASLFKNLNFVSIIVL